MGKRGPIPKSDEVRILEGNPSKQPFRGDSPKPKGGMPPCPSWLSPEAKKEWHRLARKLNALGLLTGLDQALLVTFCSSYVLWRQAQEAIAKHGTIYVTAKGKIETRPELAVMQTLGSELRAIAAELGLTPTSRARLRLPQSAAEEVDPVEELLREIEKEDHK